MFNTILFTSGIKCIAFDMDIEFLPVTHIHNVNFRQVQTVASRPPNSTRGKFNKV